MSYEPASSNTRYPQQGQGCFSGRSIFNNVTARVTLLPSMPACANVPWRLASWVRVPGASHRPFQAFTALSRLAPMSLTETAQSDLAEASASVIAEVEIWAPHQWVAVCEVHREPSNALRLAFHVASRSRRVVRAINEQPGSRVDVSQVHVDPTPLPEEAAEVVAALKEARDEALRFIVSLDDAAIERLHMAEIDGEPDALMATCGLIGHWAFHLPAIQRIQGVSA